VIVNPTVQINDLSISQLRRIYTMRQVRWSNNSPIKVFVLPNQHPQHQRFCKETLRVFPYQLDRIWHKLTFSGLGVAPVRVKTINELIKSVEKTPGAIGYVETYNMEGPLRVIKIKQ